MFPVQSIDATSNTRYALEQFAITWVKPVRVFARTITDNGLRVNALVDFVVNDSHISVPIIYCVLASRLRGTVNVSGVIVFDTGNISERIQLSENLYGNVPNYIKCLGNFTPLNDTALLLPYIANISVASVFNGNTSTSRISIVTSPTNNPNGTVELINYILESFKQVLDLLGVAYDNNMNVTVTIIPVEATSTLSHENTDYTVVPHNTSSHMKASETTTHVIDTRMIATNILLLIIAVIVAGVISSLAFKYRSY